MFTGNLVFESDDIRTYRKRSLSSTAEKRKQFWRKPRVKPRIDFHEQLECANCRIECLLMVVIFSVKL